jgi:transposase
MVSDEKRWNLNGPDHCAKSWDDDQHRKERKTVKFQCQSVYVWACFGIDYCSKLVTIEDGTLDSIKYIQILQGQQEKGAWGNGRILLQDGATWHTSLMVRNWVAREGVRVETIPPNSPDLNPIENLWGILTYRVYKGGKQYTNIAALRAALNSQWAEIMGDAALRGALIHSYVDRVQRVVRARGAWPQV